MEVEPFTAEAENYSSTTHFPLGLAGQLSITDGDDNDEDDHDHKILLLNTTNRDRADAPVGPLSATCH